MDAVDRYANEAWFESNRAHRLLLQRDALEEALAEAELEIREWRALAMEMHREALVLRRALEEQWGCECRTDDPPEHYR